jgi:hypothetical protein
MFVTVLIGMAVVGAGQLLRNSVASTAKALLEAADMETTLEQQALNPPSSPSLAFFRSICNLPSNLWHHSKRPVLDKRASTCYMQQVDRPSGSIRAVSVRASCSRPYSK